jgi:hypothetical protein
MTKGVVVEGNFEGLQEYTPVNVKKKIQLTQIPIRLLNLLRGQGVIHLP